MLLPNPFVFVFFPKSICVPVRIRLKIIFIPLALFIAMTCIGNSQGICCIFTEMQLFPVFDENGMEILPCGMETCMTADGFEYKSILKICANIKCGKKVYSLCFGKIFCCKECFEATKTQLIWDTVKPETSKERKKRQAKERLKRWLGTLAGILKKSEQNKRYYQRKKARRAREMKVLAEESVTTMEAVSADVMPTSLEEDKVIPTIHILQENTLAFSLNPPVDKPSLLVSSLSENNAKICRFPGCDEPILDERPYWGKERKFCCQEHREKMVLLFKRLNRIYDITYCPFIQSVINYLRLVVDGIPP
jgi:hypothetical protein